MELRILLTGAGGFLGSHLLERLLLEPVNLYAVARRATSPEMVGVHWRRIKGRLFPQPGDLLGPGMIEQLIEDIRPTHVLHNAWMAVPGRFWTDPANVAWMEASGRMLAALSKVGNVRFVGVGTCAEYDWSGDVFREDETPTRPTTLYGRAKAATCAMSEAYTASGSLSAAWGRVFLPFGPGDTPGRLIPTLIETLSAGREMALGDGSVERDFIFAPDAADLLVRLLLSDEQGIFNIGSGVGTSLFDAVGYIADRLERRDLLRFGSRASAAGEPRRLVADMKKVAQQLGWRAPTPLTVGLDAAVESILKGRNIV